MSKKVLIIFMKNPVKGKVKTRLAQSIGQDDALVVYQQLLKHNRSIATVAKAERWLFYDDFIADDEWSNSLFSKYVQNGNDLGERMSNAFQQAFDQGANKVMIMGVDCYDLTSSILEDAFRLLEKHDTVIGPAIDGGYYLLGMKAFHPSLFQGVNWSTSTVRKTTVNKIEQLNLSIGLLEPLNDIDTKDDLDNTPALKSSFFYFNKIAK